MSTRALRLSKTFCFFLLQSVNFQPTKSSFQSLATRRVIHSIINKIPYILDCSIKHSLHQLLWLYHSPSLKPPIPFSPLRGTDSLLPLQTTTVPTNPWKTKQNKKKQQKTKTKPCPFSHLSLYPYCYLFSSPHSFIPKRNLAPGLPYTASPDLTTPAGQRGSHVAHRSVTALSLLTFPPSFRGENRCPLLCKVNPLSMFSLPQRPQSIIAISSHFPTVISLSLSSLLLVT